MYRSPIIVRVIKSRRLRWAGHVARKGEGGSAFKFFKDKIKCRSEDNIRIDLKEINVTVRNWIESA